MKGNWCSNHRKLIPRRVWLGMGLSVYTGFGNRKPEREIPSIDGQCLVII